MLYPYARPVLRNLPVGSFCAAFFLLTSAHAVQPSSAPALVILAYNYADVPEQTLDAGEYEAKRILAHAGIDVVWRNCRMRGAVLLGGAPCDPLPDSPFASVNFMPAEPSASLHLPPDIFGTSVAPSMAHIWMARLRRCSSCAELPLARLIAMVTAHEIGHLLLTDKYSKSGIMREQWYTGDLHLAKVTSFIFTKQESRMMTHQLQVMASTSANRQRNVQSAKAATTEVAAVHNHQSSEDDVGEPGFWLLLR